MMLKVYGSQTLVFVRLLHFSIRFLISWLIDFCCACSFFNHMTSLGLIVIKL